MVLELLDVVMKFKPSKYAIFYGFNPHAAVLYVHMWAWKMTFSSHLKIRNDPGAVARAGPWGQ